MSTNPAVSAPALKDTGDAIAALLLGHGLITDKQLKHARRVRAKLAQSKTLLNTMLELEFFSSQQLNAALQGGTLVLPGHRGHRLGLALKLVNLRAVRERYPDCHYAFTVVAGVNAAMNAVNDLLGFRDVERALEMQRRL